MYYTHSLSSLKPRARVNRELLVPSTSCSLCKTRLLWNMTWVRLHSYSSDCGCTLGSASQDSAPETTTNVMEMEMQNNIVGSVVTTITK